MNIEQLDEVLESLLFISGDGLKIADLANHLELQKTEINASVNRLKKKYGGKCGIHLIVYNGCIQFSTNPEYKDAVETVLNPIKEKALSNAVLETVAIIAYRQPITKLEIEKIRCVNCDYAVSMLLKHNLIEVVGRKDVIGKPLLFGTTDEFLKRFQIESIQNLPDYDKLLESIKTLSASSAQTQSLYNEFEIPVDEPTPEFLENDEINRIQ